MAPSETRGLKQHQTGREEGDKRKETADHQWTRKRQSSGNQLEERVNMTCNDMQQALLILICHSSHHITLKTNPWLPRLLLAFIPPPLIIINYVITIIVPFGSHGERCGKIQLGHVVLSPPVLPSWPVACQSTTPSVRLGEEKGKKERQTRPGSWD